MATRTTAERDLSYRTAQALSVAVANGTGYLTNTPRHLLRNTKPLEKCLDCGRYAHLIAGVCDRCLNVGPCVAYLPDGRRCGRNTRRDSHDRCAECASRIDQNQLQAIAARKERMEQLVTKCLAAHATYYDEFWTCWKEGTAREHQAYAAAYRLFWMWARMTLEDLDGQRNETTLELWGEQLRACQRYGLNLTTDFTVELD